MAWVQERVRSCQPLSVCDPSLAVVLQTHVGPSLSSVSQSSPAWFGGARLVPGTAPQESRLRQQHSSPRACISPIGTFISPAASEARVPVKCWWAWVDGLTLPSTSSQGHLTPSGAQWTLNRTDSKRDWTEVTN